jgi:hypothetical protein
MDLCYNPQCSLPDRKTDRSKLCNALDVAKQIIVQLNAKAKGKGLRGRITKNVELIGHQKRRPYFLRREYHR